MGVTLHLARDAKEKDRRHRVLPAHAGTTVHLVSSESRTLEAATQPQMAVTVMQKGAAPLCQPDGSPNILMF